MACQVCIPFIKSAGDAVHLAASNPVIREAAQGMGNNAFLCQWRTPVYLPRNILGKNYFYFNSLLKRS